MILALLRSQIERILNPLESSQSKIKAELIENKVNSSLKNGKFVFAFIIWDR